MQKIVPCLWFDSQAEEAIQFYIGCFPNSQIHSIARYPEGRTEPYMQGRAGKVITAVFTLNGYRMMALDGGPQFKLNPSISFVVNCPTAEEVERQWAHLSEGATILMPLDTYPFSEKYGWLQDRYGVSWQVKVNASAPPICPMLMFTEANYGKAEEAIRTYTALFPGSQISALMHQNAGPDHPDGTVAVADFQLGDDPFRAADNNGEHGFTFNEAVSLVVECDTQAEVDHYWYPLSAVPAAEQCGWLKDKFGVSWQITPKNMGELMNSPDPVKAGHIMTVMLNMKKLDIQALKDAAQ